MGCGAAVESGVFDLEMEGASNDLDAGSDGATDLTLEDGRERVPVASDSPVGRGGCPPGSESACEGIGVLSEATRRSDRALEMRINVMRLNLTIIVSFMSLKLKAYKMILLISQKQT